MKQWFHFACWRVNAVVVVLAMGEGESFELVSGQQLFVCAGMNR